MNKKLYVYINDKYEGVLNSEDDGKISFSYDEQAKMPLSMSLPIKGEAYSNAECHGYFNGLLPENNETRKFIGLKYGINPNNDFSILKAIFSNNSSLLFELEPSINLFIEFFNC